MKNINILEFHAKTAKILNTSRIPCENYENHENCRNPCENNANHENHEISKDIQKNHENSRMPRKNYETN